MNHEVCFQLQSQKKKNHLKQILPQRREGDGRNKMMDERRRWRREGDEEKNEMEEEQGRRRSGRSEGNRRERRLKDGRVNV